MLTIVMSTIEASSWLGSLIFLGVWLLIWLPIAVPLAIRLQWHPPQPITPAQKLPLLASLYLLAPLVLWGAAHITHQTFASYGLPLNHALLVSLSWGFLLGGVGLVGMFGMEAGLGWLHWQVPERSNSSTPIDRGEILRTLLITLFLGLWISLTEELVFRGFLLNQFQRDLAAGSAAAIVSIIFALLHLIWEGRDNLPQLPGLWLMGMVLALARWVDQGNLGLAWGLHAGWIWVMASIDTLGLVRYGDRSPVWLTGLGQKPLAGLIGLLFLLLTGTVLWSIQRT